MPTMGICIPIKEKPTKEKLIYGHNFNMSAKFIYRNETTTVSLIKNSLVRRFGLKINQSELKKSLDHQRQCYKISFKWNGRNAVNLRSLKIQKIFKFSKKDIVPQNGVKVALTTEDNSYGLTREEWYDGNIDLVELYTQYDSHYYFWYHLYFYTQELHINKVTEYQNIVCSNDSYYKCLARRFIDYKISVESKRLRNHVSNGHQRVLYTFLIAF